MHRWRPGHGDDHRASRLIGRTSEVRRPRLGGAFVVFDFAGISRGSELPRNDSEALSKFFDSAVRFSEVIYLGEVTGAV